MPMPKPRKTNDQGSLNVVQCWTRSPNAWKHVSA